MELTRIEQNQINDFKAQYESLLNNIKVANSELGIVILERDKAELDYKEILEEYNSIKEKIELKEKETASFLEKETKSLRSAQVEFNEEKQKFFIYKDKTIADIEELRDNTIKKVESQDLVIGENKKEIQNLSEKITLLNVDVENLTSNKSKLLLENKSAEETLADYISKLNSIISEYEKTKPSLLSELEDLSGKVELEKSKIEMPMATLVEETQKLDKRKRNFDILLERFKKQYKIMYPNQEIKI